ncbi:MAG: hypothetical protein CMJ20_10390 [Phycisphaeraceae bacterium]|nr:hypothetical protein [Phycisphaeraceae bacterium]|tara:strand:- start:765 stop:1094 length:330 start_codon:yes stop_codon:yes gene_type:complete
MSVSGAGTAAGVAQAAHQSEQVARRRDKQSATRSRDAERLRDLIDLHLHAVEQGNEPKAPSPLRVNEELPQDLSRDGEEEPGRGETRGQKEDPAQVPKESTCRHLDIRA